MSMDLKQALEQLELIADNHRLMYDLEAIDKDRNGARCSFALLRGSGNKAMYLSEKLGGDPTKIGKYVEEEVMVSIYREPEEEKWKFDLKIRRQAAQLDANNAANPHQME